MALVAFVLLFAISVEIAVFGWPLTVFFDAEAVASSHLNALAYTMLGVMTVAALAGLIHDAQGQDQEDIEAHG